jgi:GUN4-like/NACHT domain
MSEEQQNLPEASSSKLKDKIGEMVIKSLMTGGVGAGGLGAFWSLFKESDIPKAIASGVIGLGIAYGASLLDPVNQGNKRRLKEAGQSLDGNIDETIEKLKAKATGATDAYLICQALDCRDYKSEGMGSRDRIAIPMLQEVYVPLELDSSAVQAGLGRRSRSKRDPSEECIWDFLAMARKEPAYRKLAIIAWGGFGKTTLLKHLAYTYGMKQHKSFGASPLVPVLLPLRKYRKQLVKDNPPSLPELVMQYHVKELENLSPKLKRLPAGWFEQELRRGNVLVMLDGFDEIPEVERSHFERWINAQIRSFDQSIFLLTSRPTAYKENYNDSPFTKIWVNPLTPKQQEAFVRQWYLCQERLDRGGRMSPEVEQEADRGAESLLSQVRDRDRPELADLAQNPLLLNLLARTHRSDPSVELPRQRAELYQDVVTLQLRKRPAARDIPLVLSPGDRQNVLQEVALVMMARSLKLIPEETLTALVGKILQQSQHSVSAREFLKQIIEVSELMVRQGLEGCEFSHLSFQEFLAAAQIKAIGQEAKLYPYLKDANMPGTDKSWWRGTILLYASQVNPTSLIREAMKQDSVDLAYDCWQETRYTIDTAIESELKSLEPTLRSRRYKKLQSLLASGNWREADQETYRVMIQVCGKEEGQGFSSRDLQEFPCEDLLTIDRLWVEASNGHFGFSVQKKIWEECGSPMDYNDDYKKFMEKVGWRSNRTSLFSRNDL